MPVLHNGWLKWNKVDSREGKWQYHLLLHFALGIQCNFLKTLIMILTKILLGFILNTARMPCFTQMVRMIVFFHNGSFLELVVFKLILSICIIYCLLRSNTCCSSFPRFLWDMRADLKVLLRSMCIQLTGKILLGT